MAPDRAYNLTRTSQEGYGEPEDTEAKKTSPVLSSKRSTWRYYYRFTILSKHAL